MEPCRDAVCADGLRRTGALGIVGLEPSFGLIDVTGIRPAAPGFDMIGTFGRTIAAASWLERTIGRRGEAGRP